MRLWGIVAAIVGYFLTFFVLDLLGLNLEPDNEKCIGFIVGLGIFFLPQIIGRRGNKESYDDTTFPSPELPPATLEKLKPYTKEMFTRVGNDEDIKLVAKSISDRTGASSDQVILYMMSIAKYLEEKQKESSTKE